jgi:hypothetical protein
MVWWGVEFSVYLFFSKEIRGLRFWYVYHWLMFPMFQCDLRTS